MRRLGQLNEPEPEMSEINISPLIDMVFILLIFFIVTAVFVEEPGVEVNRPPALTAGDLEKRSLMVAVTADGRVVYGGREIGITGVRPLVRRFAERDPLPVILIADAAAPGGLVIRAIDEAKLGGAPSVSLSTAPP